jgi:hypothetical protein
MADNSKKPGQNLGKGKQGNPGSGANRLNQDENLKKKTSSRLSEEDRDLGDDQKRGGSLGHNNKGGNNKGNKR